MSSSTRHHLMGEAEDNWLRQLVLEFRDSDDKDKPAKAKQALNAEGFIENNPCHVYWQGQFRASESGNSGQPNVHKKTLNVWVETVHILHELNGDEESSYVDEWLVLAYYRLFRCYNECEERFTLKGLDEMTQPGRHRASVLHNLEETMVGVVPKFQKWRDHQHKNKQGYSDEYHKLRFEDATWEGGEDFRGLYNKEPREFTDLMNNEHRLFQSSFDDKPFDVSSLEGNTLITFFTDDLNFWATALLDRLGALAPVALQTDSGEERKQKESGYLNSWERTRIANDEAVEEELFSEYRIHVEKFSMLMELLYDLKDKPALIEGKRPHRLREYAELAHLHCIIAALPAQRKKWDERLKDDVAPHPPHPPWSLLRTSNDARTFLELSAEERYEKLILHDKKLGYALASVVRWLAHRTNGFYTALASNVQEGVLITNKTRRKATSSSWGEKVVIKHVGRDTGGEPRTSYHQFISSANGLGADALKHGLDGANRYFNQKDQGINDIEINPVCFDVLQVTSREISGQLLSEEWERARANEEMGVLVKHFAAIVDFFLLHQRKRLPSQELLLSQATCLPRLQEHESYNRVLGRLKLNEQSPLPVHLSEWIHGDEWGENFTLLYDATSTRMYAIDLEDAIKRNLPKEGMKDVFEISPNGGYHGQRLYQKAIHQGFNSGIPIGAFNALTAVGRLLAALIQKSTFNTPSESGSNVQILYTLMKEHQNEKHGVVRLEKNDYNVIWLSLFDWLLHWTTKVDPETTWPKFSEGSYEAHLNAFVHHPD